MARTKSTCGGGERRDSLQIICSAQTVRVVPLELQLNTVEDMMSHCYPIVYDLILNLSRYSQY